MKRATQLFILLCTSIFTMTAFAADADQLSYRTFLDHAKDGKVKSVIIHDHGTMKMEAIVLKEGVEVSYNVEKPYHAGEDILLLDFLDEQNIPHEIYKQDFRNSGHMWAAMLPALLMFAVPGALLVIILILAFIINSKVSRLERMVDENRNSKE